jgi:hypothetical protein
MIDGMDTDRIAAELRAAKAIYEAECREAMARRDAKVLRARRAGWSNRRISAEIGYTGEHVATMAEHAEAREADEEPAGLLAA